MPNQVVGASASVGRLPRYLAYLKIKRKQGVEMISSTQIAKDLQQNAVQVRKDLQLATSAGRPKTGYPISVLIEDLESYLGYHNTRDAFLVGVGRMGRALLGYTQFSEYGLTVLAGFDIQPTLAHTEIDGKPVLPMSKLPDLTRRMQVAIGILTVPEDAAQEACDRMVESGLRAIWNFTAAPLKVPEGIVVKHESLAASFAVLCKELTAVFDEEKQKEANQREHHDWKI